MPNYINYIQDNGGTIMTGRTIEIIVLIVLIAVTAYFWNKSKKQAEAQKKSEPQGELKIIQTAKIDGMMCQKCAAKVTEALSKFGTVEVNLEEKTATITGSELADPTEIEALVTELGFKFMGMEE